MAAEKHPCAEDVPDGGRSVGFHACSRNGTFHEDGKWWCRQHAPSAVAARRGKRETEYQTRKAIRDEADARADAFGKRAGCQVQNVRSYRDVFTPTTSVQISEADLDRLLKEAGL